MFDRISERFDDIFRQLRGQGRITERNIDECLKEIRRSLLEADVNFKVTRLFISRVREQALGEKVLRSLTASQQLVKIVHDELVIEVSSESANMVSELIAEEMMQAVTLAVPLEVNVSIGTSWGEIH